jgi:hypothetical protein
MKRMFEGDALEYFARVSREQKKAPAPLKAHRPHVSRHMSPRQRAAFAQTSDIRRSTFRTVEKADADWSGIAPIDESIATRNVGPKDFGNNYCHGKETNYTGIRQGKPER